MSRHVIAILYTLLAITAVSCTSPPPAAIIPPDETTPPAAANSPSPVAARPLSTVTLPPIAASSPTAVPTTSPAPAVTPSAAPVITVTAEPHPLVAYTIPAFQAQEFPGGPLNIRITLNENETFSSYYIDYPSGDLSITGLMHVPAGEGPFPVLILLHGYFERDQYYPGADTWQAAEQFVENGYLVLSPDLRSWGESDPGLSIFHMGLVADVLHLISSLSSIPAADPSRVGLWGHSMGGGMATKILTIDDRVQAAVLYAPNSADDADLITRWGPGCQPDQSEAEGDHCNPGEFIPAGTPPDLIESYLAATADPGFLQQVAPIYHLDNISVPLQIHIGTADGSLRTHTPPEWSDKLAKALQVAGKDVEFFTYPAQGHYFTAESWTLLLERSLELFNDQLKTLK